jgi:decaprenylphospho-beta-D-erythro-pentofuranosid-2-ulose 2-reductase
MKRKILVLGATSTVAMPVIEMFCKNGDDLLLAARNEVKLFSQINYLRSIKKLADQKILSENFYPMDLLSHEQWIESAVKQLGGLDLVFVAYGQMLGQKTAESSWDLFYEEQTLNYLSVASYLHYIAKYFEKLGSGTFAIITSVAGDRMRRSNYVYGLSKACLSLYLECLRTRLANKAISVIDLKLGFVASPMTKEIQDHPLMSSPEQVAPKIFNAINNKCDVVYIPGYWRYIMFLIKCLPRLIFYRLKI